MTTSQHMPAIRNFHSVTDWLYRGGQPSHEGICELAALGVKTVISLRAGKRATAAEQKAVEASGMRFIHMPVYYVSLPDEATIERFLEILDDTTNHPIYIHCFHGADRTGFLVAIYRMARMGWSVQQAYAEMKRLGFHRFRLRHFKWTLFDYARKASRDDTGNKANDYSVKRS